jgi:hypothetical protein
LPEAFHEEFAFEQLLATSSGLMLSDFVIVQILG